MKRSPLQDVYVTVSMKAHELNAVKEPKGVKKALPMIAVICAIILEALDSQLISNLLLITLTLGLYCFAEIRVLQIEI